MSDIKSILVARPDEGVTSTYAQTPGDRPNLVVEALSPLRVVITRTVRVYQMSVAVGGITLLQNLAELLAKVDQKYPELRA